MRVLIIGNIATWRGSNTAELKTLANLNLLRSTALGLVGAANRDRVIERDTNVVNGMEVDTVDILVASDGTFTITPK